MISVLVVDDHPLVREHVARAIGVDERMELAGLAADGEDSLRQIERLTPDVVVLDVEMPKLDGASVLRMLRERKVRSRVLVLTGHARPGPLHDVLHHQPDSLLRKDASAEEICDEIVAIERGDRSPAGPTWRTPKPSPTHA